MQASYAISHHSRRSRTRRRHLLRWLRGNRRPHQLLLPPLRPRTNSQAFLGASLVAACQKANCSCQIRPSPPPVPPSPPLPPVLLTVVVLPPGSVVSEAHPSNAVIESNAPTAHGRMIRIRLSCLMFVIPAKRARALGEPCFRRSRAQNLVSRTPPRSPRNTHRDLPRVPRDLVICGGVPESLRAMRARAARHSHSLEPCGPGPQLVSGLKRP